MIDGVEKYYIRVNEDDCDLTENHFIRLDAHYSILSKDMANGTGTTLFSVYLTREQALIIKLSCPLVGCLNFGKALGKLVSNCV